MSLSCTLLFSAVALWTLCMTVLVSGASEMLHLNEGSMQAAPWERVITPFEIIQLLDYHNFVRSQVSEPAANMEFMVWNETVASRAASWASQCTYDHGPDAVMKSYGQNLAISSSSSSLIADLARSWNAERFSYSFPKCLGSFCGHYTQMVWATSTQLGCAVKSCSNITVSGNIWKQSTFLVCNYYPKGNMDGVAPYLPGKPCSACPLRYKGSCKKTFVEGCHFRKPHTND